MSSKARRLWKPGTPQAAIRSLEKVAPCLIEGGLGPLVASGSERFKDTADTGGATRAPRGHSDQCPVAAEEILVSVDVAFHWPRSVRCWSPSYSIMILKAR